MIPLIWPYLFGGGVAFRGGVDPLDLHDMFAIKSFGGVRLWTSERSTTTGDIFIWLNKKGHQHAVDLKKHHFDFKKHGRCNNNGPQVDENQS